ncbi:MAG: DNA mismatch repair endonuclease MutL [Bacillota bacterium]|nr:DNA mismatch repair endonuclease MutL [Bacillota bacterium]
MNIKGFFERKKILSLPKSVADRIAAGEVVDRPVSIIKELTENCIDAGADSVTVEIKNGGKSYIRVTDNGCGIPPDEVEAAFFRHATNKIVTDSDLTGIRTLGFRGEALASIAAVSRTQMITRIPEEAAGVKLLIEGGKIVEKVPVGASEGTTIVVTDLFYNTPAREKFLKKDGTESSMITDFISKMAMAYPYVKFKFINNGKILFSTSGRGDVLQNIYMIFGKETASSLIPFENEEDGMHIKGYISNPSYTKSSRRNQFYFVNGRYVVNKTIEKGLSEGCGDKIPEGRYPVAYLFLDVPPESVDVNVHPNKKEIRFGNPKSVENFVRKTVFDCLNTKSGIADVPSDAILKRNDISLRDSETAAGMRNPFAGFEALAERENQVEIEIRKPERKKFSPTSGKVNIIKLQETKDDDVEKTEERNETEAVMESGSGYFSEIAERRNETKISEKDREAPVSEHRVFTGNKEPITETGEELNNRTDKPENDDYSSGNSDTEKTEKRVKKFDVSGVEVMGILFDTYIAARDYETFYLIDQHAAHERVFYEKFRNAFYDENSSPQMLLAPLIKEIPYYADEEEFGWKEFLTEAGFILEHFGGKSYLFKGIPSYMSLSEAEGFLDDYIDSISESTDFKDRKTLDKIIMKSCKSAVKAHDRLSLREVEALLNDLSNTENPFSCPHGRPAIVKMGVREMEKMFKRI